MIDDLFDAEIKGILEMGKGVKALLFDDDTRSVLSNLIPHSKFLEKDYFLFDNISNKKREKIANITCVVVIRPENIKLLIEEVSDPSYEQYIVLFTNQMDPLMVEILATSDTHCVISEVHEIYIDLLKQDEFLYTLCGSKDQDVSFYKRKRIVDGLFALMQSLERVPTVKVQANNPSLLEDSETLSSRMAQLNFAHGGTIIMLDRSFDLYTPLLYEWRYQGLLHEHANYENGTVKIGNKTYSMTNDPFFNTSKFKDIYEVSEDIKGLIKRAEVKKNKLHNLIFDDLEENARISQQVEAHLAQHGHVMKECLRLKDLSEMEMNILQSNSISYAEVNECLARKDISAVEGSKLLLIHSLKNRRDLDSEAKRHPELARHIESFRRRYMSSHVPQFYGYRFDSDIDIKLGYQPPLKRIIRHWWNNKLREKHFSTVRESEAAKDFVVVYVRNGLTYSEYRVLHEYYRAEMAGKSKLYIISDIMITYKNMLSL